MFEFMKCVVEGIAAAGVGGLLAEFVPGGQYIQEVGAYAIEQYRKRKAEKRLEDAVKELIAAKAGEAITAARRAVEEAAPRLPRREKELVLQFVSGMPAAARNSMKRADDPTGTTAPAGFRIDGPEDVVKLLPAHPPRFVPGEWVPGRAHNWRLVRRLGGGGFGEVWLARNECNKGEKPRAVKFCTDPTARARLIEHEMHVIRAVMNHVGRHPNIVPLVECHLTGATPWLMYEYVRGGTLADAIGRWQQLDPAERLARVMRTLYKIAGAVGSGHAVEPEAVVHRDLKPANVLMDGDSPRITDYGIGGVAVAFQVAEERTGGYTTAVGRLPSVLSGSYSLLYSSPQQRAGDPPDPRDDVHALGVLAYQMLVARVDKEVKGNWQDRLRADRVPKSLITLIGRSASEDVEDRPKDAREWQAALVGRGVEPLPPKPPAAKPRTRWKVAAAAAGVVLAAGLAYALVSPLVGSRKAKETADRAGGPSGRPADSPAPPPVPPKAATAADAGDTAPARLPPKAPKPGDGCDVEIADGVSMAFCWVPAGETQLGSPDAEREAVLKAIGQATEPDWLKAEAEEKRGTFRTKGFWMGKYAVTQQEWAAVMRGTDLAEPSYFRTGGRGADELGWVTDTSRFPVEQVSWNDCQKFLARANARGGVAKAFGKPGALALPHEDAWEYACRGGKGNQQPFHFGRRVNGSQANINGNFPFPPETTAEGPYKGRTTPVGAYAKEAPHPWGLCDMHGNVSQWCDNLHDKTNNRVLRGGSWFNYGLNSRAAHRNGFPPDDANENFGFRVCVSGL
jgi:formylglycine-generating enzyme required for sulfatase activity/serine/threonine protein kinase